MLSTVTLRPHAVAETALTKSMNGALARLFGEGIFIAVPRTFDEGRTRIDYGDHAHVRRIDDLIVHLGELVELGCRVVGEDVVQTPPS